MKFNIYSIIAFSSLMLGCTTSSNEPISPIIGVVEVLQPNVSKVALTPNELTEEWDLAWEADDMLSGWRVGSDVLEPFTIMNSSISDGRSALFSGVVTENSTMRMVYPHDLDGVVTSDGMYEVDLTQQTIDMAASYNSLAEGLMYMVSDPIEVLSDGAMSKPVTMRHVMSAVEIYFTPSADQIDTQNNSYELVELSIFGDSLYHKGCIDMSGERAQFVNGVEQQDVSNTIYVTILNSPKLCVDELVVIPVVIAPTTFVYKAFAYRHINITFKYRITNLATGDISYDYFWCKKNYPKGADMHFERGTHNIITATFE